MKFGIRIPSLKRRFAARTSWKRIVRHSMGLKVPRGMGVFTNPKKALYNRIYNKTSVSVDRLLNGNSKTHSSLGLSPESNMNVKYPKGIEISNTGNIIRSSSKALTVTSKNFKDLRNQITDTYNQRVELKKEFQVAKIKLFLLTILHFGGFLVIVGFFYKKIAKSRNAQQEIVKALKKQISETFVNLSFADKTQLEKSWLNCVDAFNELAKSEKMWDLTYTEGVDKISTRTIAESAIKRTPLHYSPRNIEFIKCDLQHIFLPNANGADLFFFPTFLILFKDNQEFGIFDLKEIKATMKLMGYIEEEGVPKDTEVINHTWKKANKDGSADKRFKGNYQIPIVKYGDLFLQSEGGLEESFMFSNFDAFTEFSKTYEYHISLLGKL